MDLLKRAHDFVGRHSLALIVTGATVMIGSTFVAALLTPNIDPNYNGLNTQTRDNVSEFDASYSVQMQDSTYVDSLRYLERDSLRLR